MSIRHVMVNRTRSFLFTKRCRRGNETTILAHESNACGNILKLMLVLCETDLYFWQYSISSGVHACYALWGACKEGQWRELSTFLNSGAGSYQKAPMWVLASVKQEKIVDAGLSCLWVRLKRLGGKQTIEPRKAVQHSANRRNMVATHLETLTVDNPLEVTTTWWNLTTNKQANETNERDSPPKTSEIPACRLADLLLLCPATPSRFSSTQSTT